MLPLHNAPNSVTFQPHTHGLPELAFLMSTDEEFSVFRSFSELSSRNLLMMQVELADLDHELHALDRLRAHNVRYEEYLADVSKRDSLLERLNVLIEKYHTALLLHKKVLKLKSPSTGMVNTFDHWMHRAVLGKSVGDASDKDVADLRPSTSPSDYWRSRDYVLLKSTPPDSILERFTRNYLGWFFRDHPPVPSAWSVFYFSRAKVERIKDYLAFPLACIFLIGPAMLFHYVCDGDKRLAILLSFIIGLSLGAQIIMGTTRKQTLGVALAYTGVMSISLNSATQSRCQNF